jgi:hypothetical protein
MGRKDSADGQLESLLKTREGGRHGATANGQRGGAADACRITMVTRPAKACLKRLMGFLLRTTLCFYTWLAKQPFTVRFVYYFVA